VCYWKSTQEVPYFITITCKSYYEGLLNGMNSLALNQYTMLSNNFKKLTLKDKNNNNGDKNSNKYNKEKGIYFYNVDVDMEEVKKEIEKDKIKKEKIDDSTDKKLQTLLSYFNIGVQQEYLNRVLIFSLSFKGQRC